MDRSVTGFDHRSLAGFRIAFGATLLGNLWARAHDGNFVAHYSEVGVFPMDTTRDMAFGLRWSIFDAIGTEAAASVPIASKIDHLSPKAMSRVVSMGNTPTSL